MLALAFLQWWYGEGWLRHVTSLKPRLEHTYASFSVPQLLRTLVAPWRRILTPGGGSLGERLRAMVDNTVSRGVGLVVRLITLLAAAVIMIFWLVEGLIMLVAWPLLPLIGVVLIAWGIWR